MCTDTHALTFEGPGERDGSVTYAKRFLLLRHCRLQHTTWSWTAPDMSVWQLS